MSSTYETVANIISETADIPRDQITILVATGLHRPNEGEEMVELVGRRIAAQLRPDLSPPIAVVSDGTVF